VLSEFAVYRGLMQILVSIVGAPQSGKTKLAKALKKLL